MARLYRFITENALMSLVVILWAITLTTWVTIRVFGDSPPDVPAGTAAALTTVFGLPTLGFTVWKWRREQK
ncbi:hypothetical protein [Alcanivorax sp. DP30]|uniref:hypothetical protein n=1 Tax=Alcanivorax sp. DP30 TaxID=2606217 RepID=UPI0013719E7E|nr:hypothetical protein [Alcanivorax sp. DP30]MZR63847.1 hypothetical protein [Alcanivorax sp. DP30]